MNIITLLGTTLGLGFTAGLNLYATIFATGLGLRMGWMTLPVELQALQVLARTDILVFAGALYTIEFIADKIPFVDHAWDLVHTFIRPLGAAWLAWTAMQGSSLTTPGELMVLSLAGGVSLTTHSGKAASRLVSSAAGGHFVGLGTALSVGEDIISLTVAPLAIAYPHVALVIAILGTVMFLFVAPTGYRFLRSRVTAIRFLVQHKLLERTRRRLRRADIPLPVVLSLEKAGVNVDEALVLAGTVSGHRKIRRFGTAYVGMRTSDVVVVQPGLFGIRTTTISRHRTELIRGVTGCTLAIDSDGARVLLRLFPVTTAMQKEIEALTAPPAGVASVSSRRFEAELRQES